MPSSDLIGLLGRRSRANGVKLASLEGCAILIPKRFLGLSDRGNWGSAELHLKISPLS